MKHVLVLWTALILLVPRIDVAAAQTHDSQVARQHRTETVETSQRVKANRGTYEDRIRAYGERVLGLDGEELEEFMALAQTIADFLGVDLQSNIGSGGFLLLIVLYILLIIIGLGFV